jgi:hypothetical protein
MEETLTQLMAQFNVAEQIAPDQIQTIQTERLQVERLVVKLKDGTERMFYKQSPPPHVQPIVVNGTQIRRKSCWHRKPAK